MGSKIHCEHCGQTMLQRAWQHLNPIRFFTNSRDFCQGMSPWQFYSYLPIAAIRYYRSMIPDVLREIRENA